MLINVVGAGSLGSFSILLLSKMASVLDSDIRIWDFDTVETHNIMNQLYNEDDIGQPKVIALSKIIKNICKVDLIVENKKVDSSTDLRGIVIVLVDKMSVRKEIFDSCKYNIAVDYFIEVRTGENQAFVYAFDPKNHDWVERYAATLYKDEEAQTVPCATPETVPTLWTVAAVISELVLQFKKRRVFTGEFISVTIDFNRWPSLISWAYLDV